MLNASDLIAFAASVDLARSRGFYGGVLGLGLVEENPYACVFDANGTMLRVTLVEQTAVAPYTVLGWGVKDIDATIADLSARGIEFARYDGMGQTETGVWVAPGGARIAWFPDPDGNTLSLTQFV